MAPTTRARALKPRRVKLAEPHAAYGRDVLLVGADELETASDLTTFRNERTKGKAGYTSIKLTGAVVCTEVARLRKKYDDIVIDTGGRDTTSQRVALTVANVLLIPFAPRSLVEALFRIVWTSYPSVPIQEKRDATSLAAP